MMLPCWQSEGESNVETMKGKIQREGELAKDVLERIGEVCWGLL